MAFNHEDTEYYYNNALKPAIKSLGFTPIRVDKINHNDRIDERIRKEIRKADLVVADLTYARPSVYWEAGYGERIVPVVYSCRSDHFTRKESDFFGNNAIHFDLLNANIIKWEKGAEKKVKKELVTRLLYVTRDIRASIANRDKTEKAKGNFKKYSISEQEETVDKELIRTVKLNKFTELKLNNKLILQAILDRQQFSSHSLFPRIYYKLTKGKLVMLSIVPCSAKLSNEWLRYLETSSLLEYHIDDKSISINGLQYYQTWNKLPEKIARIGKRFINDVVKIRIVPIIARVNYSNIDKTLAEWRTPQKGVYELNNLIQQGRYSGEYLPAKQSKIIFLDEIESKLSLVEKLKSLMIS